MTAEHARLLMQFAEREVCVRSEHARRVFALADELLMYHMIGVGKKIPEIDVMIFTKTTQRSIQKQTRCRQMGLLALCIAQTALYTTRSQQVESVWRLSQRAQGIYVQAPLQETETPEAPLQ